jgi:Kef-type K+ transport system membrane component KefB
VNIWTFVGNVGVTLMIFQSGMHIHFDKVAQVGRKAFVVAIFGTALPLLTGMAVVGGLTGEYYPSGFAAGCAFAPLPSTSVSSSWTRARCSIPSRDRPPSPQRASAW